VEQEDALIGSLTVRETLMFAARLSLSPTVSKFERSQRVETLIAHFGLSNQADDLVGTPIRKGISGGQKRRLSVAAQLITAPKVLFLDEPTSGLDSAAAFEVVFHLKQVAQKYKVGVARQGVPAQLTPGPAHSDRVHASAIGRRVRRV
jgi:ABC-type multidrug transport system ATPase subunit